MVETSLSKELVTQRAIEHMAAMDYKLVSQTETMLVFEDGKDIKTWLLVLGILFLLLGAILYYILAKTHNITVTVTETDSGRNVQCSTNTQISLLESDSFLSNL